MSKNEIAVIIRYALMIFAGRLAAGGWLPESVVVELTMDPTVAEMLAGGLIAFGTFVYWRYKSFSAKALKRAETRGL